jgi:hypothetical protein
VAAAVPRALSTADGDAILESPGDIFAGFEGERFGGATHVDSNCQASLSVQLGGEMRWWLWAPWQVAGSDGAVFEAHSRHETVLRPGEMLVWAPGWFHATHIVRGESLAAVYYLDAPVYSLGRPAAWERNPFGFARCGWALAQPGPHAPPTETESAVSANGNGRGGSSDSRGGDTSGDNCLGRALEGFGASTLPLFGRCRSRSCVRAAHKELAGGRYVPVRAMRPHVGGAVGGLSGQAVVHVREVACRHDGATAGLATAEDDAAVRGVWSAIEQNEPLVLRGCARSMAAVTKWADSAYLAHHGAHNFAPLLNTSVYDRSDPLRSAQLLADLEMPSELGALLRRWSGDAAPSAWVTRGGKRAAMHFDSFENVHVMVSGAKHFRLVSPVDALAMYIDFAGSAAEAEIDEVCPDHGTFGCDGLGCYAFVPFDASSVDVATYPRVQEAVVHTTTLEAGDALVLPSFWFHYIEHLPLDGSGRNVAVTFTNQLVQGASVSPLASAISLLASRARRGDDVLGESASAHDRRHHDEL